jgi:hypothetical protein
MFMYLIFFYLNPRNFKLKIEMWEEKKNPEATSHSKRRKISLFFFPILNWRSFLLHVLVVDEGGHDSYGSYKIRVGMMVAMIVK